jgi:hypothetical protein
VDKAILMSAFASALDDAENDLKNLKGDIKPSKSEMEVIKQFNSAVFSAMNQTWEVSGVRGCVLSNMFLNKATQNFVKKMKDGSL